MSPVVRAPRLPPRHRDLLCYLRGRGWTHARQVVDDEVLTEASVHAVLRDLDRIGLLDVRLVGGGFCEWRHRETA